MKKELTFFCNLGALYKCQMHELLSLFFGGNIRARPFNLMKSGGFREKSSRGDCLRLLRASVSIVRKAFRGECSR